MINAARTAALAQKREWIGVACGCWLISLFVGCGGTAELSGGPNNSPTIEQPSPCQTGRKPCGRPARTLPPLPPDFPKFSYRRYRQGGRGMFLLGLAPRAEKAWLIVFNARGKPLWWERTSRPILQNQILSDGTIVWARSFRDGYGVNPKMAHEVHGLNGELLGLVRTRGTVTDGHEFHESPSRSYYLDSYPIRDDVDVSRFGGRPHASVADAEIQEVASGGRLLWRWNSRGHIRLAETGRWWHRNVAYNPHIVDDRKTYDAIHINSIDLWGETVVISTRHTDAIYGISRGDGRVLWKLGGTPTPQSLRVIGDPYADELFGGQHDARIHGDGLLSVYDDATHRPRRPRAVFYRIDPERRTATFIRQLTDPIVRRSHCCGSVRPFAGGWLVDWGDNPLLTQFNSQGQPVFRMHLAASSYRAVPLPASVTEEEIRQAMMNSESIGQPAP